MCRNIKQLFNFDPPATDEEIHQASLQFVRKISGSNKPSQENESAFNKAVEVFSKDIKLLLHSLKTKSKPRSREIEAARAKERAIARFGNKTLSEK